jgi:transcriptional regulator with XRE-family HTH domain
METLGDRIKHLRLLHKLSLAQLGAICGVSAQAVHGWESGATENIKLPQFLKLCAHFSIDPYVLVFPDEKQRPHPSSSSGRYRKFPSSS